jgi:ribosome-associated translation inhibitor RaiA
MENMKISCGKGAYQLDEFEKNVVEKIASEYKMKIERHFKDIISFDVYVKCFSKEGNVKRYEINSKLIVPGHVFETSSDEYKLHDAIIKALEKLMTEIEHKIHVSSQGNEGRKPQNIRKR